MVIILIAFNIFMLYTNIGTGKQEVFEYNLEMNSKTAVTESLNGLLKLNLIDTNNQSVDIKRLLSHQRLKLFIFFSPKDCPSCLQEISLWNRINKKLPIIVTGLIPHYNAKEVKIFAMNEGIEFEIWIDRVQKLFDWLDFSETPIKVLLDKSNKVVSITKSFLDPEIEKEYYKFVQKMVKSVSS